MTDRPVSHQQPHRRRLKFWGLAIGLLIFLTTMLTTRLGVWIFLDVLGSFDEQTPQLDAAAGPAPSAPLPGPISSLTMPPGIEQPSGIAFDWRTRTWAISTDQAELFILDESMGQVLSRKLLMRTLPLLRQGRIEAVTFVPRAQPEDDRLAFTGEIGTLELWRRLPGASTAEWEKESSIPLDPALIELEASALAFEPSTGQFWMGSSESSILYQVDLSGSIVGRQDLNTEERWPSGTLLPGRRASELKISGLSFAAGHLWAVSENYTTLLQLDPRSGSIVGVWSLPGLGEASDLALVEGAAVFTIDHNWNDPRPAFRRVDVPASLGNGF